MTAFTRMSEKGQVVIPKDVRDRLRLDAGDRLEVIERSDGVFLRKAAARSGESFDEVRRRIRAIIRYDGPPATIDEMTNAIRDAAADHAARRDDRARD